MNPPTRPRAVALMAPATLVALVPLAAVACGEGAPDETDPALLEAVAWYTGTAGRVDDARARELLEAAAGRESTLARMWIARVHSRGRMGYAHDEALARDLGAELIDDVRALADAGVPEAVFLMGTAHDEGLGVPVDHAAAAAWYRRAADLGHGLARHNLGNMYREARGVSQSDSLAAHWWRLAAEEGDAITELRLAEAYEAGRGVPLDVEAAREWYARAAARGNEDARAALARLGG